MSISMAVFSKTGMLLGTPMFMAPEQITAKGVDDRVDIYALGLTMYFALTGRVPYPDLGLNALINAHLNEDPEEISSLNTSVSSDHMIIWIVKQAVAKNPVNRFQNTLQMLEALNVCRQFLDSGSFPTLRLQQGVLISDSNEVVIDPETPSSPLASSDAYLKDGSAISSDFVETLGDNYGNPGTETFPGLTSMLTPTEQNIEPSDDPPKAGKTLVAALIVIAILVASAVTYQKMQAPVPAEGANRCTRGSAGKDQCCPAVQSRRSGCLQTTAS